MSDAVELVQDQMSPPKPSNPINREEIRAIYAQGEDAVITLVERLLERISQLEARLDQLEHQQKQDSRNSSKPPSGDGFSKGDGSTRCQTVH